MPCANLQLRLGSRLAGVGLLSLDTGRHGKAQKWFEVGMVDGIFGEMLCERFDGARGAGSIFSSTIPWFDMKAEVDFLPTRLGCQVLGNNSGGCAMGLNTGA